MFAGIKTAEACQQRLKMIHDLISTFTEERKVKYF